MAAHSDIACEDAEPAFLLSATFMLYLGINVEAAVPERENRYPSGIEKNIL
jgi:hypothetical protein